MDDQEPRKIRTNVVKVDAVTLTTVIVVLLLGPLLLSGFLFQ